MPVLQAPVEEVRLLWPAKLARTCGLEVGLITRLGAACVVGHAESHEPHMGGVDLAATVRFLGITEFVRV